MISLNVMVVDDSQLAIRKMEVMLVEMGHKVVQTASNGSVAVANYRKDLPDLVTMDITMPEMDGIEATGKIIAEFPDAKIIMITSHGQEDMVRQAIKAGARGYVMKPVKAEELTLHIQRVINL